MSEDRTCPIWGTSAEVKSTPRDGYLVDSPRAGGVYFVSRSAAKSLRSLDDLSKAKLTTWLVTERAQGNPRPEVMTPVVEMAEASKPMSVSKRADGLLAHLAAQTSYLGETLSYASGESLALEMLAASESSVDDELDYLLRFLSEGGYINLDIYGPGGEAKVLMPGYDRVDAITKQIASSSQGFVAMWFDKSLESAYYEGIYPAISDAGYAPMRIDQKEHNNKIDDEIIGEIRRSKFVVADFTQSDASGARGGVYYEAGFAHGLNIPLIMTCREDCISNVHFDTRQYSHILWSTPEDLRQRLSKRISATFGDGPKSG